MTCRNAGVPKVRRRGKVKVVSMKCPLRLQGVGVLRYNLEDNACRAKGMALSGNNPKLCGTWKAANTGADCISDKRTVVVSKKKGTERTFYNKCINGCESRGTVPVKP